MPTGWDSILTIIIFGDCYADGLEMLLGKTLVSLKAVLRTIRHERQGIYVD